MALCFLYPGTSVGSTGSGSGFKASQKTGFGLKSHPTDREKLGVEPGLLNIILIILEGCHTSINILHILAWNLPNTTTKIKKANKQKGFPLSMF